LGNPLRRRTDYDANVTPRLRALIVEDDENYGVYVASLLRRFGFDVVRASEAMAALRALEETPFDFALIDCEMPGMSGLELISEIRRHPRGEDLYALMLTGRTDLDTKISALRLGFDDFLVKSTTDVELVAKIGAARRLLLRQRRLDDTVRELYGLATRDELTGLFNRRYFFSEAERILGDGTTLNLILFDLDDFKAINDTFGHLAGDRILRDIGTMFLRRTRHDDLIARYGGDEFVLIATNTTLEEVYALAKRLGDDIAAMQWVLADSTVHVGVTTGVATSDLLDEPTVARLLNAGDRDLYKNKWLHSHPDLDPSLYEYDHTRSDRLASAVDFPLPALEEAKKQQS